MSAIGSILNLNYNQKMWKKLVFYNRKFPYRFTPKNSLN